MTVRNYTGVELAQLLHWMDEDPLELEPAPPRVYPKTYFDTCECLGVYAPVERCSCAACRRARAYVVPRELIL
jgi:hypothetical protein